MGVSETKKSWWTLRRLAGPRGPVCLSKTPGLRGLVRRLPGPAPLVNKQSALWVSDPPLFRNPPGSIVLGDLDLFILSRFDKWRPREAPSPRAEGPWGPGGGRAGARSARGCAQACGRGHFLCVERTVVRVTTLRSPAGQPTCHTGQEGAPSTPLVLRLAPGRRCRTLLRQIGVGQGASAAEVRVGLPSRPSGASCSRVRVLRLPCGESRRHTALST